MRICHNAVSTMKSQYLKRHHPLNYIFLFNDKESSFRLPISVFDCFSKATIDSRMKFEYNSQPCTRNPYIIIRKIIQILYYYILENIFFLTSICIVGTKIQKRTIFIYNLFSNFYCILNFSSNGIQYMILALKKLSNHALELYLNFKKYFIHIIYFLKGPLNNRFAQARRWEVVNKRFCIYS